MMLLNFVGRWLARVGVCAPTRWEAWFVPSCSGPWCGPIVARGGAYGGTLGQASHAVMGIHTNPGPKLDVEADLAYCLYHVVEQGKTR